MYMYMYEAFMLYYIQLIHLFCLVTSNKLVTVPRQDSICTCKPHAVLSGYPEPLSLCEMMNDVLYVVGGECMEWV